MDSPMSADAGTQGSTPSLEEQKLVRFVHRRYEKHRGTDRGNDYFALLYQLVENEGSRRAALDIIQGLEDGNERVFEFLIAQLEEHPDDVMLSVISAIARGRIKRRRQAATSYQSYGSTQKDEQRSTPRTSQRVRVPQSRLRSREQSHAPRRSARSTPKAASRSGDSDPAGDPEPPRRRRFIVDDHYLVVAVVG